LSCGSCGHAIIHRLRDARVRSHRHTRLRLGRLRVLAEALGEIISTAVSPAPQSR